MNKNLILIIVAVAVAFLFFKMMKMMKEQSEIMKAQSDVMMAVALKTGALQPVKEEKKIGSRKEATAHKANPEPPAEKSKSPLTAGQKRIMKLFDDEIPKTAGQLRTLYNKTETTKMETKQFNSALWNIRNNKGLIVFEKFEDSDSIWGLVEWFEEEDGEHKLTDEYFSRVIKNNKA